MRLIILTILAISLLLSCTSEPTLTEYKVFVTNKSSSELMVEGFDSNDNMIYQSVLQSGNSSENCVASLENFDGLATCNTDSLVFKFPLNKGYICALRKNGLGHCFNGKTPFEQRDFQNLENNTFEFVITQEDFDNAHELPE